MAGEKVPARMGPMQADWMEVGLRMAIAASESMSHLSRPNSLKSDIAVWVDIGRAEADVKLRSCKISEDKKSKLKQEHAR